MFFLFQCLDGLVHPQDLPHAPGLGKAALALTGVLAIVDLRKLPGAALPQHHRHIGKSLPNRLHCLRRVAVDFQICPVVGTHREHPDRALMVGHIPLELGSAIVGMELGILRG